MGSDMYMMERDFRPRPNKSEWQGDDLVIYTDSLDGFKEYWRGPVTDSNRSLILKMIVSIPVKPVKPVTPYEKTVDLLKKHEMLMDSEAIQLAQQIEKFYE